MIVETKNGLIRGIEKQSVAGGKKYFSYLGVPYAKPPVGELRFAVSTHPNHSHVVIYSTGEFFSASTAR